jgi:hypothetical protein
MRHGSLLWLLVSGFARLFTRPCCFRDLRGLRAWSAHAFVREGGEKQLFPKGEPIAKGEYISATSVPDGKAFPGVRV